MSTSTQSRYSTGAMWFHWIIAIAVIVTWRIAEAADHADLVPDKIELYGYHKALGITILVLSVARLIWRWAHPVPPLPAAMATWERILSKTVHVIFYVLLIGLPIGGWLANSLAERSIDMFGFFTIPGLPVGANEELAKTVFDFHATGGHVLIYLVGLHILGALKHTFIDKNGGIFRMLPFGKVSA